MPLSETYVWCAFAGRICGRRSVICHFVVFPELNWIGRQSPCRLAVSKELQQRAYKKSPVFLVWLSVAGRIPVTLDGHCCRARTSSTSRRNDVISASSTAGVNECRQHTVVRSPFVWAPGSMHTTCSTT